MTLYEELGGFLAVQTVVDHFYDRVLLDPSLAPFFQASSMSRQRRRVAAYVAGATGGPAYQGPSIRAAHAHLEISRQQFDAVAAHLGAVLEALGVPRTLTDRVLTAIAGLADDVVAGENTESSVA
jgi:hemoglobin